MDFKDILEDVNINKLRREIEKSPIAKKIYAEAFEIYCNLIDSELAEEEQNDLLKEYYSKLIRVIKILDSEEKIYEESKYGHISK